MTSPKKYDSRPSPSWSANDTPGEIHKGNDGNMWISTSVASGKYYRWKRTSKSPAKKGKKSPAKKDKKTPVKRPQVKKDKKSPAKKSSCPTTITRGDSKLIILQNESTARTCSYKRIKISRTPTKKSEKSCPVGKIMNPKTGRCVSKTGAIGKSLQENKTSTGKRDKFDGLTIPQLKERLYRRGVSGYSKMNRAQLVALAHKTKTPAKLPTGWKSRKINI